MNATTPSSSNPKKRELFSPEFLIDLKKNRVFSGSRSESESESEISDLSSSQDLIMASNMESTSANGVGVGEESALLTLQDTHLQKIAALMRDSFQPQVAELVQESFQTQVSELVKSIVQGVLSGLNEKLSSLESENSELKKRVKTLEDAAEEADQYSRRTCLLISGMPEEQDENTDELMCTLARAIDVDIIPRDIDRTHRLGKPSTEAAPRTKPRNIVVKFATYNMRRAFYKAKSLTKDRGYRGVFINEHLTKSRSKLLYEARRRVKSNQLKSAWSSDGNILTRTTDAEGRDRVRKISSVNDLPEYVPSDEQS